MSRTGTKDKPSVIRSLKTQPPSLPTLSTSASFLYVKRITNSVFAKHVQKTDLTSKREFTISETMKTRTAWYNTGFQTELFPSLPRPAVALSCFRQIFYLSTPHLRLARSVRVAFVMLDEEGGRD